MPTIQETLTIASFEQLSDKDCHYCGQYFLDNNRIYLQDLASPRSCTLGVVYPVACDQPHMMHTVCMQQHIQDMGDEDVVECNICQRNIGVVSSLKPMLSQWLLRDRAYHELLEWVVLTEMKNLVLLAPELKHFEQHSHDLKALIAGDDEKSLYAKSQWLIGVQYLAGWKAGVEGYTDALAINAFYEALHYGSAEAPQGVKRIVSIWCEQGIRTLETSGEFSAREFERIESHQAFFADNPTIMSSFAKINYLFAKQMIATDGATEQALKLMRTAHENNVKEAGEWLSDMGLLKAEPERLVKDTPEVGVDEVTQVLDSLAISK